jgi:S-DNA-T family DNA segregation ATPase FtsK/SpoIIIE
MALQRLRGAQALEAPASGDGPAPLWERHPQLVFGIGLLLLMVASTTLEFTRLYRLEPHLPGYSGGVMGYVLGRSAVQVFGFAGSALLAIGLGLLGCGWAFRFSWLRSAEAIGAWMDARWQSLQERRELAHDKEMGQQALREREELLHHEEPPEPPMGAPAHDPVALMPVAPPPEPRVFVEPQRMVEVPKSERVAKERQKPLFAEMPDSKLPQVALLDEALLRQETVSNETLEMTSRMIEKKLKDFGVEVRVVLAQPGPVITRYEIEPATGVKGSQIVGLAKDLARSLSLVSIRVVETIPGKNYMALELPNAKRQSIRLSEILGSQVYNEAKSMLTMGLGKDIIGNPIVADLAKMPHVLVAGTTGSGKSVGINAMILSLLYKAEARDVRLLMIDPKMLEMSVYEGIPHLLAPVVTDMRQAAHGLNWCVAEMEKRYKLMSKMGVRNLAGFNAKLDEAKAQGTFVYNPFSLTPEAPEPLERLPHIVVVIDELADLMMVVGKKIEELIARLAQKARAAGIHLILATQRPSVDVITGLIKANIPTRIAFQVSSKIDSRTILDQMGAEALLGMGDMLYMPSGTGLPIRVHGAFVSDEEVHRVVKYLKEQGGEPNYVEGLLEGGTVDGEEGDGLFGDASGEKDPMYDQAVEVVLKNRKASISLVQRHLKIGYNRAARLVEDMEKAGLVSAMSGSGQREILVPARAS